MKIIFYGIMLMLVVGCTSPFTSTEQAKNELNKEGFRKGRWVDYLNENHEITKDTSEYVYYLLSEYSNGHPIGGFLKFYRGGLKRSEGAFLNDSTKYDQYHIPQNYFGKVNRYNKNGQLDQTSEIDTKGMLRSKIIYLANKDSIRLLYSYFLESEKQLKKISLFKGKTAFFNLDFNLNSWTNDTPKIFSSEFYKNYVIGIDKIKSESFDNESDSISAAILCDILKSPSSFLFLENFSRYDINGKLEKQQSFAKLFKKDYHSFQSNKNNSFHTNDSGLKGCRYCGRRFNKNNGYVIGIGLMGGAESYSSAMWKISVGSKAGYPKNKLKQLKDAYELGEFYCSRKCVNESGNRLNEF